MKKILFSILFFVSSAEGALNKTYPTAATTVLRLDAYNDEIKEIWKSTTTEFMRYEVDGSTTEFGLSASTIESIKLQWINEVVDKDMEQYMVFPSSYVPLESKPWLGWCINSSHIYIPCP
jgi:hypothetical protein